MLSNDFQSLEDLRFLAEKCPRCSLCKFPPLVRVEHADFSGICPSYEELGIHAASGGGLLVMAMSVAEGRSQVTETVRRLAFSCHACGGCDVACKFSSDIEVLEVIYQLRAKVFAELGALPAHATVLESISRDDHPLPGADLTQRDALAEIGLAALRLAAPVAPAEYLLWLGPHYALEARHHPTLANAVALLRGAGVSFTTLGRDEPYAGRAALEIGDRDLFRRCATRTATAIAEAPARRVLCLSAEDYATLRALVPRVQAFDKPVEHITEMYAALIARGKLRPRHPRHNVAAWHDSSYLGRLSEPYQPWQGEVRKGAGQIVVYDPPRPVRRGGGGCYEPPRRVLAAIPGLTMRELPRRREYAFDAGESGQVATALPELAARAAARRVAEARASGADLLVTECPQSLALLDAACGAAGESLRAASLTDILAQSILGGDA